MAGHLFVVRGDLRRLACDAWGLPSAEDLFVSPGWSEQAPEYLEVAFARLEETPSPVPPGWGDRGVRAFPLLGFSKAGAPRCPAVWLLNTGAVPGTPVAWYLEAVRQFLDGVLRQSARSGLGRAVPLVGLPLVGTGLGGGAHIMGEFVRELVSALAQEVAARELDVALVIPEEAGYDAVQAARKQVAQSDSNVWAALPDDLVEVADRLAQRASAGELVLFLGAGVSVDSGLPTWEELLGELADAADIPSKAKEDLHALDLAELVRLRLAARPGHRLSEFIEERFGRPLQHSLSHALLASLPVREVVTTNYDSLFEEASKAAGVPVAVLPRHTPAAGQRWVLKMHGSADRPKEVVLSRSDYLRYADRRGALAGIVQAMLITKHMLFVGFSLNDDNFFRIASDVRQALSGEEAQAHPAFGTALTLQADPIKGELWAGQIDTVPMVKEASPDEEAALERRAARLLEMFLDRVLAEATVHTRYLLRPAFDGLLSEPERRLRDDVHALARGSGGAAGGTPAWAVVERMLRDLGHAEEPGGAP